MDMTSPLFDPQFLAQYRAMMEPPQEAKKQAGMDSLLALGLGLLANRSPHLGPALGNAGFAAMGTYRNTMDTARQNRMGEVQGAMGLRKLQQEMQVEARCWCGSRANNNARLVNGVIVYEGETVVVGDTDKTTSEPLFGDDVRYELLCRKHYLSGDLGATQ